MKKVSLRDMFVKQSKYRIIVESILIVSLGIAIPFFTMANERPVPSLSYEPIVIETIQTEVVEEDNYSQEACEEVSSSTVVELTIEEAQLLMKLARSEAGDNGVEAQLLVMNVVMNRVKSEDFPDTIKEVIYAKNQFAVTANGVMDKTDPNADTHLALAELEQGEDISEGALYFEANSNSDKSWHSTSREFLFEKYGQRYYR